MVITAEEVGFVLVEFVVEHGGTDFFGEADDEAEVVNGGEAIEFALFLWVAGTPHGAEGTESPAGATSRAIAAGVEDAADVGEFAEVETAVAGVDFAVASFAGRGNAIEGVGTHFCTDEDVVRMGETEEVAGLVKGQFFVTPA